MMNTICCRLKENVIRCNECQLIYYHIGWFRYNPKIKWVKNASFKELSQLLIFM